MTMAFMFHGIPYSSPRNRVCVSYTLSHALGKGVSYSSRDCNASNGWYTPLAEKLCHSHVWLLMMSAAVPPASAACSLS